MTVDRRQTMTFETIAANYDTCTQGLLARCQRHQVWVWLDRYFQPGMQVLELGCGTGLDALHLAQRGLYITATDPAPTMVAQTLAKAEQAGLGDWITGQVVGAGDWRANTKLYDGCFSNFSGVNCVADLGGLAATLAQGLKPGASLILILFGRHCLWEILVYGLQGRWSNVSRRWQRGPVPISIGPGITVDTYYHSTQALQAHLGPWFEPVAQVGIGVAVPPIYAERAVHPSWIKVAQALDLRLGARWPYQYWGDHSLSVWRRRS